MKGTAWRHFDDPHGAGFGRWTIVLAFLGVCLTLLVAATWPRDDGGTPAAQCAYLDSGAVSTTCGVASPMPILTTVGGATSQAGYGRQWFESTAFGTQGFTGPGLFVNDIETLSFRRDGPGTNIVAYRSFNGGRTWTSIISSGNPFANSPSPAKALLISNNRVAITTAGCVNVGGPCSPFGFTDAWGNGYTLSLVTGLGDPANPGHLFSTLRRQGSTILSTGSNNGAASICRSINNFVNVSCAAPLGTFAGAAGMTLESPTANTWLQVSNQTPGQIFRSTNNGTTWASVFTFAADTTGATHRGVECLTSTVCLATNGARIVRSIDAGATWTTVYGPNSNAGWAGFADFGSGRVQVVSNPMVATHFWPISYDSGSTWTPGPVVGPFAGAGAAGFVLNVETRGDGRAVVWPNTTSGADADRSVIYTTLPPAGSTLLSDTEGDIAAVDANGNLNITGTVTANLATGSSIISRQGAPDVATQPAVNSWHTILNQGAGNATIFNSRAVSAANAAVTTTLTQAANVRQNIFSITAFCSAGTSRLSITDAALIWETQAGAIGTAFTKIDFAVPFTLAGATPNVTLDACGAANTGTLMVQAARY